MNIIMYKDLKENNLKENNFTGHKLDSNSEELDFLAKISIETNINEKEEYCNDLLEKLRNIQNVLSNEQDMVGAY